MKNFFLASFIVLSLFITPVAIAPRVAHAGIVPSCNTGPMVLKVDSNGKPLVDANGVATGEKGFEHPCDFEYVIILINSIITFLVFTIATPLAALIICYAGWIMLTAGGSSEKVTKAKSILKNLIIGYIIALAAWLIVKTIFSTLGFKGETFLK